LSARRLSREPEAEYRECQLKARFLTMPRQPFQLIETMLSDGGDVLLLPLHLDRLMASADYFDFAFDRGAVEAQIATLLEQLPRGGRFRVRLLLDASGGVALSHTLLTDTSSEIAIRLINAGIKKQFLKFVIFSSFLKYFETLGSASHLK